MLNFAIEIIQSICLIVAAIIIVITALGILRLDDDMDKVIYVRIHMLGMVDIACVLAMIGLGQFLLAGIYFILAPFVAHAMANAYYYGEDDRKYETSDELTGRIDDNIRNELAINDNTTIDAEFKFDAEFKSKFEANVDGSDTELNVKSGTISYSKITESKGTISSKLDVVIKEISTDDLENSSLNTDKNLNKSDNGGDGHD